jgi:hypothetical protein
LQQTILACLVGAVQPCWGAADADGVRNYAEQSFSELTQRNDRGERAPSAAVRSANGQSRGGYSPDQYVIGVGQGDMSKGPIVCQRVSELSARTDLAKQIRIFVKEHMVDRIRERSGKAADQDVELTREEIVQEYLQGVKIVDRQIDEDKQICTATAVMPRSQLNASPPPHDLPAPAPTAR